MKTSTASAVAALLLLGTAAHAHITLEYQVAPAGASYKASLRVGHGCDGSPTRQVSVLIPQGVRGARPMPKAGWSVEVQRQALAQPSTSHGRTVAEDVVRVTWTARTPADTLAAAHYDEFILVAQMPERPGTLYWPVNQVCEQGRLDWVEIPAAGQKASSLKAPAPTLEILPAVDAGHHRH